MALDIPEEMSGVSVVRRGMGWKELAVIGAAAVASIWLAAGKMNTPSPALPLDDREYDVTFYDSEGQVIPVEKLKHEEK